MGYSEQRAWSDQYMPAVKRHIGFHLLEEAPEKDDLEHATDLRILHGENKRIAVRVRRAKYYHEYPGEFTIRSYSNGHRTEFDKIMAAELGHWFFYGFAAEEGAAVPHWCLMDLAAFRYGIARFGYSDNKRKLGFGKVVDNGDGTKGRAFEYRWFAGQSPSLRIACSESMVVYWDDLFA